MQIRGFESIREYILIWYDISLGIVVYICLKHDFSQAKIVYKLI